MPTRRPAPKAFTLVELLVVIGIIALLIGMLMPALSKAMRQAKSVACQANLHNIGQLLLIYANNNRGVIYPIGPPDLFGKFLTLGNMSFRANGTPLPREERWPAYVFDPPVWNPRTLICPDDPDAAEAHSYILNKHLEESPKRMVRTSNSRITGITTTGEQIITVASDIVVMGEKVTQVRDYYMEQNEYDAIVEHFRHGEFLGSNYLFLDWHVATVPPKQVKQTLDPWEPTPTPKP